jgi:hypothetical protein
MTRMNRLESDYTDGSLRTITHPADATLVSSRFASRAESKRVSLKTMNHNDPPPLVCRHCSRPLPLGRGAFYVVRIEAVADPSPPVFTEEDLAQDCTLQIKALLDRIRTLTEPELEAQVHQQLAFLLCVRCYSHWINDPTGANP